MYHWRVLVYIQLQIHNTHTHLYIYAYIRINMICTHIITNIYILCAVLQAFPPTSGVSFAFVRNRSTRSGNTWSDTSRSPGIGETCGIINKACGTMPRLMVNLWDIYAASCGDSRFNHQRWWFKYGKLDSNQKNMMCVIGYYGHTTIPPGDLNIKHVDFVMGLNIYWVFPNGMGIQLKWCPSWESLSWLISPISLYKVYDISN